MVNLDKQKHKIMLFILIIFCLDSIASGVGPNEVIVWDDANFQGISHSYTLDPSKRHVSDWKLVNEDKISSIEVGSDVKIVVFRDYSFAGSYTIFESSVNDMSNYWNDEISSIIIFPKGQAYPLGVTLSETAPYTITGYEPASQFFPLPENLNDNDLVESGSFCRPAFFSEWDWTCSDMNYITIKGDNIEVELYGGTETPMVLPPQKNEVYRLENGEYNGFKFYRLGMNIRSMKLRWTGGPKERSSSVGTSTGEFIAEPASDQKKQATTTPTDGIPRIVGVSWQPIGVIQVTFDQFPAELWNHQWEMYIDNNRMPVEAPQGYPNVRPNAELEKNPTGILIGTLPWPSSLITTDFPCCGAIKFCIPGKGCSNEMNFDLAKDGCKTASKKNCNSGMKSEFPAGSGSEGQSPSGVNVQVVEPLINPENIGEITTGQGSEALPEAAVLSIEKNTDRPGMNYRSYYLSSADPQICVNDCANDPSCAAFTYVEPGFRGLNSKPECWLKNPAPNSVPQEGCISGMKSSSPPSGSSSWGQSP